MYTLAIEIHGLRQLTRLQPELIADMRRRTISSVEVHGGSFVEERGGLWVFRFERAQPDDRQGVLEALSQAMALLEAREQELAGWTVFLDYLDSANRAVAEHIHDTLLPVYLDNTAWLGTAAHSLLAHDLEISQVPHETAPLYRILGRRGTREDEVGSVLDMARSQGARDVVVDELVAEENVGGVVLVLSDDPIRARVNARSALEELMGAAAPFRWLEAEPDDDQPYAPLLSVFRHLDMHETRFWLPETAREVWDERAPLIAASVDSSAGPCVPDSYETDILISFESYLIAHIRRAADAVVPPVLLCHHIDRWPTLALDALVRTVGRLPAPEREPGLIVLATAARPLSGSISKLVRRQVRLPRSPVGELREKTNVNVNWERAVRVSHGRAAPLVHYLTYADHWDALTDADLDDLDESDLAWQVVRGEDSDIQEIMLAAILAGTFLSREQFTEVAVALGVDRVRVPAVLSRLRLLGLIVDRERVVPSHPEHRERLDRALGRAAGTVYTKVASAVLELVQSDEVMLSESLLLFLAPLDDGEHVPELYHRLVTRHLAERRLGEAQRLLYDSVPSRGFSERAKACMQTVLAANRMRLALLQGNMQSAERTRALSDRSVDADACESAAGDLALQKARLTFHGGPTSTTTALLKRAVMVYQELDDQSGLARANLDFGLVLLAQEDLLGAREYFLLAGHSADNSSDIYEQIRARQLTMICDFVYGNLSRALAGAAALDEVSAAAGMREVQLFAELTRGRVLFELGRYAEAADAFSRGRSRSRLYGMSQPGSTMEHWLARSLVYDERVRRGVTILEDDGKSVESLFFLAEARLRRGEHAQAIAAVEEGLNSPSSGAGPVEGISWTSGFAPLEDRAIGVIAGSDVLRHQMMALRGYVLAESGQTEEGVREMHRLTREMRISEIDPYNRLYFYLYSLILPESGELNLEDGTTVLGKAVRYIQQRTSRMDEYAHKTDFLRRNYWNAGLMSHAQSHNLV